MFDRFDQAANDVLRAAFREAADLGDGAVGTEHLLLALATTDPVTANLLADAGVGAAALRRAVAGAPGRRGRRRRDHDALLAALGIELAEVRRRVEESFGSEAIVRAVRRAHPPLRRSLWSRISCSQPLPRRCDSPLAGQTLALIPRMKRLLERAGRAARPGAASPGHLLLALVTGNEPAGEVLTSFGVDLFALEASTRHRIAEDRRRQEPAS